MKVLILVLMALAAVSAVPPRSNLRFLARQEQPPKPVYGPPPQEYGPPKDGDEKTTTERPLPVTTPKDTERFSSSGKQRKNANIVTQKGVYYVYHPTGLLQRISYTTTSDVQDMGYTAQYKYQNVDPITDPIYTYDPETLELKRVDV